MHFILRKFIAQWTDYKINKNDFMKLRCCELQSCNSLSHSSLTGFYKMQTNWEAWKQWVLEGKDFTHFIVYKLFSNALEFQRLLGCHCWQTAEAEEKRKMHRIIWCIFICFINYLGFENIQVILIRMTRSFEY